LAIAIWFFIVQGGMESNFALALVAFIVGLVTNEIIKLLFNFIRRIIGRSESEVSEVLDGSAPDSQSKP
jgi:hypothetical protein